MFCECYKDQDLTKESAYIGKEGLDNWVRKFQKEDFIFEGLELHGSSKKLTKVASELFKKVEEVIGRSEMGVDSLERFGSAIEIQTKFQLSTDYIKSKMEKLSKLKKDEWVTINGQEARVLQENGFRTSDSGDRDTWYVQAGNYENYLKDELDKIFGAFKENNTEVLKNLLLNFYNKNTRVIGNMN